MWAVPVSATEPRVMLACDADAAAIASAYMTYSLLYVSRCVVPADGLKTPDAVAEIVEYSQRSNAERDITGALVWTPNFFAQILEGLPNTVRMVYAKIARDSRHTEVTLLDTKDGLNRDFEGWSLAYAGGSN